jgi:hypothetical protein
LQEFWKTEREREKKTARAEFGPDLRWQIAIAAQGAGLLGLNWARAQQECQIWAKKIMKKKRLMLASDRIRTRDLHGSEQRTQTTVVLIQMLAI